MLSQSINTPAGKNQIGRGVRTQAIQGLFHQGSFVSTSVVTDVAMNGPGYFVLTQGEQTYYTRAGEFRVDSELYLEGEHHTPRQRAFGLTYSQVDTIMNSLMISPFRGGHCQ